METSELDLSVYRDPLHERDLNLPPENLHPKQSLKKKVTIKLKNP